MINIRNLNALFLGIWPYLISHFSSIFKYTLYKKEEGLFVEQPKHPSLVDRFLNRYVYSDEVDDEDEGSDQDQDSNFPVKVKVINKGGNRMEYGHSFQDYFKSFLKSFVNLVSFNALSVLTVRM